MIFPKMCRVIGYADKSPLGCKVYFLTQYILKPEGESFSVLKVTQAKGSGLMRDIEHIEEIARPDETAVWKEPIVTPHDRVGLIKKALSTGKRCTVFGDMHSHMTFVLDPDLSGFLKVHLYDIVPPHPSLALTIASLEKIGFFEDDDICFEQHIKDIREIEGDVYPCKAGGFAKTLDRDAPKPGDRIVCCDIGKQMVLENYGNDFTFSDTCPLSMVKEEPFIVRCCKKEHAGLITVNGKTGIAVHWACSAKETAESVEKLITEWRKIHG